MSSESNDSSVVLVEILAEDISLEKYTAFVADSKAGALSSFIGVTRDNFDGKTVCRLEYEAYVPMALRYMKLIGEDMKRKWDLCKVAIAHRKGVVLIGQPSVIIVASSPHRKDSLEAVSWAIDELKKKVPIWKKEFFPDGSIWKENKECKA